MMNEIKDLNLDELMKANGGVNDEPTNMITRILREKGIHNNEQDITQIMNQIMIQKRRRYDPTRPPFDPARSGGLVMR